MLIPISMHGFINKNMKRPGKGICMIYLFQLIRMVLILSSYHRMNDDNEI